MAWPGAFDPMPTFCAAWTPALSDSPDPCRGGQAGGGSGVALVSIGGARVGPFIKQLTVLAGPLFKWPATHVINP